MIDLNAFPRISLSNLESPLEESKRLSALFPNGPEIYVKRDDFIGSLVWGNKLRKLEFVLADAIIKGLEIGKRLFGMEQMQIIGISADSSVEEFSDLGA